MFIAFGRTDLFSVPFDCDAERERGLLLHTPTFSARLGADGFRDVLSFLLLSIAFSRTETGNAERKNKKTKNLRQQFIYCKEAS